MRPTASAVVAEELGALLQRHGSGGGWVIVDVEPDGPLFAKLLVIDAAAQRSYAITVEQLLGPPRAF